jgi:hypothetical protein
MIGKVFSRLTVISLEEKRDKHKQKMYLCKCACGNEAIVLGVRLRSGHTRSCGCIRKEGTNVTHRMTGTPTYSSWQAMKERCSPTSEKADRYANRGITIDPAWESFDAFLADMGAAPDGMTLERINNDVGYCKANCKWADRVDQARNRTSSKLSLLDASLILTLKKYGLSDEEVAQEFSVCDASVSHIVHKRNWKDAVCLPV